MRKGPPINKDKLANPVRFPAISRSHHYAHVIINDCLKLQIAPAMLIILWPHQALGIPIMIEQANSKLLASFRPLPSLLDAIELHLQIGEGGGPFHAVTDEGLRCWLVELNGA